MTVITSTEEGAVGRYINLGSPSVLDDVGAQTHILYLKPSSFATPSVYLLAKGASGGAGFRLFLLGNTEKQVALGSDSSTNVAPSVSASTSAYSAGSWEHFVFTWDGSVNASGMKIFIGATDVTASPANGSGSISSDAAYDTYLMNRSDIDRAFIGDMAYEAWWSRILDSTARANVIANGPLAEPTGLIMCWANGQDYGPYGLTASSRSARVTGSMPPNTALGGGGGGSGTLSKIIQQMRA